MDFHNRTLEGVIVLPVTLRFIFTHSLTLTSILPSLHHCRNVNRRPNGHQQSPGRKLDHLAGGVDNHCKSFSVADRVYHFNLAPIPPLHFLAIHQSHFVVAFVDPSILPPQPYNRLGVRIENTVYITGSPLPLHHLHQSLPRGQKWLVGLLRRLLPHFSHLLTRSHPRPGGCDKPLPTLFLERHNLAVMIVSDSSSSHLSSSPQYRHRQVLA